MIVAVGLTPAWQRIFRLEVLRPGEVNRARDVPWCASGKVLNVGLALRHLNGASMTLAPLGGPYREAIEREFDEWGASARFVPIASATRVCTTVVDMATGQPTELVENAGPMTPGELQAFAAAYTVFSRRRLKS